MYLFFRKGKWFNESDNEVSLADIGKFSQNPAQWAETIGGIVRVTDVHESLRIGDFYYKVVESGGSLYLNKFKLNTDEILDLPQSGMQEAMKEMEFFLSRKEAYKKFGVLHKRGFMLYGPPGNGKSALIARLTRNLGKAHGLVTLLATEVSHAIWAVNEIRAVEPERPIMVIFEEIDNAYYVSDDDLLTFLDGEQSSNHMLFLATTNYYDQVPDRLKRAGRFDCHVKVENPSEAVRFSYFTSKLGEFVSPADINNLVVKTDGFSLSSIKEVCVLHVCLGVPLEDALERTKPKDSESE